MVERECCAPLRRNADTRKRVRFFFFIFLYGFVIFSRCISSCWSALCLRGILRCPLPVAAEFGGVGCSIAARRTLYVSLLARMKFSPFVGDDRSGSFILPLDSLLCDISRRRIFAEFL